MGGIEDLLKIMKEQQRIQSSFGLSSQLSESLKAQAMFPKSLGGLGMLQEIAKNFQHQQLFDSHKLTSIDKITKSLKLQSEFAVPKTTLDAITSINRQHDQLFGNLRSVTDLLNKQMSAFAQINSRQFAVNGISSQLAGMAAKQRKWDLIDDFEEITDEVVSLNERIFDENGVTKAGLNELKEFFQRIEIKVDKIEADANALFWKFLAIISFVLTVLSEARNWSPKPEYATKQEVETIINKQFTIYEKKLKEYKEFRITLRECKVMSKPRIKSLVIEKLQINFKVTVLQISHKWIYVSYFSPKDNLPQTGWIMKKYLEKP